MYISTGYVKVCLRILLKLSEALNIYKVQLRFICVRQKLIRSRFALAHLCNWYLSCCIAVLLWLEKVLVVAIDHLDKWNGGLYYFIYFVPFLIHVVTHVFTRIRNICICYVVRKKKQINYKKKKKKKTIWDCSVFRTRLFVKAKSCILARQTTGWITMGYR